MTIKEAIDQVNAIKPNTYTDADKIKWLSFLDGKIATEVYLMSQEEAKAITCYDPSDSDTKNFELLASFPYDSMYVTYLQAKVDEYNQEYDSYANTYAMFNDELNSYICWFANKYEPAFGDERRCPDHV